MAFEKHLYLTIQGGYKSAPMSAEVFQTGLRLALVFGTIDDIGTLPSNWDPVSNPHNDSDTNWTGSTNWVARGPGLEDFDPLDFLSQQVLPAVRSWFSSAYINDEAYVQNLRLYPIGPNGNAVPAPPYAVGTPAILTMLNNTYVVGAGGNSLLPLQNSIVISTRTQQVGRRGRGRMFVPAMDTGALASASDPSVSSTARTTFSGTTATMLGALQWSAGTGTAQVKPIVTGSPWTDYAVITQVRIGSIVDTQRRRRNSLPEIVTSANV